METETPDTPVSQGTDFYSDDEVDERWWCGPRRMAEIGGYAW